MERFLWDVHDQCLKKAADGVAELVSNLHHLHMCSQGAALLCCLPVKENLGDLDVVKMHRLELRSDFLLALKHPS